jgi:hypothetical protein
MRELIRGEPLVRAAMRSGMSETTAQRYRGEPGRGRAAAEGGNMTALMAEESRFRIVFDKRRR